MRIITGRARGLQLNTPKNFDVRPTADRVKESVFNIIGSKIIGTKVLDLFAGTGNLGLESWSRGAEAITFIDESKESLRLVQNNIAKCRADKDCTVIKGNAVNVSTACTNKANALTSPFVTPRTTKAGLKKLSTPS